MSNKIIRKFTLYWKHGETQEVTGPDLGFTTETLANAVNNAGIGGGALPALDYWEENKMSNIDIAKEGGATHQHHKIKNKFYKTVYGETLEAVVENGVLSKWKYITAHMPVWTVVL